MLNPRLRVDALVPPDHEDMVAEGYIDGECFVIVSQDGGFESLDVEFLARRDGRPWCLKFELALELLLKCQSRLGELRRMPSEGEALDG